MVYKGEEVWVGFGVCERREVALRRENRSGPIPFNAMMKAGAMCMVVRLRVYHAKVSEVPGLTSGTIPPPLSDAPRPCRWRHCDARRRRRRSCA